ncbi:Putative uncharacterized protein [Taphrina deformans PYCC 5710]|uniref:Transcription factor domain-containing protein n=1 Tax=Taphrina deformans (strain PYCC 5710 / ATCC 11124 / CBS 356.35 / IMI 108563 / JCM 9778 / NBRC 8474) TaxID=1097556 RepID=R4XAV2_TAPDE|nr:Putative uncharacterized protein [Taphrina deformans PYCC 5710]|eukprot:CCG82674.1 Putative uncharacterized protein [Taphrina deformans PYCC 5710]
MTASIPTLVSYHDSNHHDGAHNADHPGWHQHAIDRWFILYQPTFPVLQDQTQFEGFGEPVHPLLRSALLLAIYSITFRSRTDEKIDALLAEQLLSRYNRGLARERARNLDDRLAHLQVTMLLAIEADQRGYEVATSVHTVGFWLGQATGEAYDMKLHREDFSAAGPAQALLGRKLFLILIVLDRWHSVSTSSPPFVADTNAKFDIEMSFSGITNHLYHLSLVVGDVYQTIMTPRQHAHDAALTAVGLKAEIENWRERVDVIWGQSNLLHVAYWHLCILSLLSTSTDISEVSNLRDVALRMASTLPNSATPYTPLNHHFYALTTCVLSYLLNFDEARQDARKGLHDLREAIQRHKDLVEEDECSWDAKLLEVIGRLQASCSTSEACGRSADSRMLLSSIRHSGYLLSIDSAALFL